MKQKLLILFVFLLIGISSKVQAYSFSSVCSTGQTLYYNIKTANTVEVTYELSSYPNYNIKPTGALTIPSTVTYGANTYSVTSIGYMAFQGCTGLISVTIPNSVTSIGYYAFNGCTGLVSITIPNSVTSINSRTFGGCIGLTSITIPNSITSIGDAAFYGCTGLTSITIPNSVTSIGGGAFSGCTSLVSINVALNNVRYSSNNGVVFSKNQDTIVCYPNGKFGSYIIGSFVSSIGNGAFGGCTSLTLITIPNSITSIGNGAFVGCTSLTSITIPNSVTSIGNRAFEGCTSLTSITIPNSVTLIGNGAFAGCTSLISITIPNSVNSINNDLFNGCTSLTSISIPSSITSIGNSAFYWCTGLTSIISKALNPPLINDTLTFSGVNKNISIYVPCVSKNQYQSVQYWNIFSNFVPIKTYQSISASICQGQQYTQYGANIDSSGIYTLVYNCDSVTLTLVVNPSYLNNHTDTLCRGLVYNKYGFNFISDTTGLYTQKLQTVKGCDSIINLYLTVITSPKQNIDMVTVDNSNHNVVIWDKKEFVNHYNIYREGVVMGQFDLIATVPYDSICTYTDTNSNPTVKAYMYKISAVDTCLNESELSSSHKTMHLTIGQGMGNNWNLNWTPYEGANYTTYNIYRGINSLDSLKYLTTISASNTSYTDINVPTGYVYYQVEILKDTTTSNKSKVINSIRSNFATNKVVSLTKISNNEDNTKLYPNPTSNKAILEIEVINEVTEIIIYDLFGRIVENCKFAPEQKQLEINVEGFAKGVYNINIKNDKYSLTKKLIVE